MSYKVAEDNIEWRFNGVHDGQNSAFISNRFRVINQWGVQMDGHTHTLTYMDKRQMQ